jgi:acetoacetyl-CoA synthetase
MSARQTTDPCPPVSAGSGILTQGRHCSQPQHAATPIAALADGNLTSMGSPLVLLKKGSNGPAFFITHGLGGDVAELAQIVESMNLTGPIYGVQWRGLNGEEPHDSIEEMASYFLDAIVSVCPNGPYLLAGLSIGGLPMLEVANRLSQRSQKVALVALLDCYPHPRYWPRSSWLGMMARRGVDHVSAIKNMPLRTAIPRLIRLVGSFLNHLRSRRGEHSHRFNAAGVPADLERLRARAFRAYALHRPRYYQGRITFLHAELGTIFPKNPAKIWHDLTPDFKLYQIPCEHTGMISTHAGQVAGYLSQCIEQAVKPRP